jgi:Peptidase family M48
LARVLLDAGTDSDDDDGGGEIVVLAGVAFLCWYVSELLVLSLNRAREYAADYWSCECTGDGDALASALVKIAYGMGEVRAAEKNGQHAGRQQSSAERRADRRAHSVRAMGIFEPRAAEAMGATFIPSARALFGLFRVPDFLGCEVVARGWYHRSPAPVIELRDVRTTDAARSARCVMWRVKFGMAIAMVLGGLATMAAGMAG